MSCIITLKNPALMRFPHISCWRYCVAKCQGGTSTCIYAHAHLNPSASIYVKVFLHAMSSLSIQNLRFEQPFHSDFFMGLRKWLAYFRLNRSSGVPSYLCQDRYTVYLCVWRRYDNWYIVWYLCHILRHITRWPGQWHDNLWPSVIRGGVTRCYFCTGR